MNKLITIYVLNKKQNSSLFILSILSIVLLLLRVKITHSIYLLFLLWNLFLALIPYSISSYIKFDFSIKRSNIKNLIYLIIWLLFIPNTFYLITDFVHLHNNNFLQYIFDITLLSSFTIAGFYFGILSIYDIHKLTESNYPKRISNAFIISISYLCAFGIYLGRILRFNSWDIISNPSKLFYSIVECVFEIETIIFTIGFGSLILISYSITYHLTLKKKLHEKY